MAIQNLGRVFSTPAAFLDDLESIQFGAWRPRFVTVHHTGAPDLKTWQGWQSRPRPISDAQWLKNLAEYYGGLGWSAGPHFFVTPSNICVLSPPWKRGVHAVSFNASSWGVETVGDFDREKFEGPIREMLIGALAGMHIAAGLQLDDFKRGERGLHFHRDDPKTKKTCPGRNVDKAQLVAAVAHRIAEMTDGDHPDEAEIVSDHKERETRIVIVDSLNMRASASAKSPVLAALRKGARVNVTGAAFNGKTKWLSVEADGREGWVAASYVDSST